MSVWPRTPAPGSIEQLSNRQAEILRLLADGRSNKDIANELMLTEGTVKQHLIRIFGKLGVSNRTWAASLWHASQGRVAEGGAPTPATGAQSPTLGRVYRRISVATVVSECVDRSAPEAAEALAGLRERCDAWSAIYGGRVSLSQAGVTTVVFGAETADVNDADRAAAFAFSLLGEAAPSGPVRARVGIACGRHLGPQACVDVTLSGLIQESMRLALLTAPGAVVGCPRVVRRLRHAVQATAGQGGGGLELRPVAWPGAVESPAAARFDFLRQSWERSSDGQVRVYSAEGWPSTRTMTMLELWAATARESGVLVRRLHAPPEASAEAFERSLLAQLRGELPEPGQAGLAAALRALGSEAPAVVFVCGVNALAGYQAWRREHPAPPSWSCALVLMDIRAPGASTTVIRPLTASGDRPLVSRLFEIGDALPPDSGAADGFERQLLVDHAGGNAQAIMSAIEELGGATTEHLSHKLRLSAPLAGGVLQALADHGLVERIDGRWTAKSLSVA